MITLFSSKTEKLTFEISSSDNITSVMTHFLSFLHPQLIILSRVKTSGNTEDIWRAFIWCDDWPQTFHLFVVTKVFDPVKSTGSWWWNVPFNCGVTLPVGTLQPVEPATRTQHQCFCFIRDVNAIQLSTWSPMMHQCGQCSRCLSCCHISPL